ncbi:MULTISPECIES: hypothetical protein [unclassified Nocardioides]|uniref:hypothetical protein n=1 Tax=unclassified Nocardioides TaxID=2615069 RepID=UPI003014B205
MSTNEPPVDPPAPPPQEPPAGGHQPYGATPPPPPPAGTPYGAPPTGPASWELGAALSYGWKKFQEGAAQWIIAGLVLFVGVGIAYGIGFVIMMLLTSPAECTYDPETFSSTCTNGSGFIVTMIATAILIALILFASLVIGAGLIRGALGVTEGRPFQAASIFKLDNLGPVVVTSLLIAAGTFVGYLLCFLPGIAFAIATSYSLYFVIDKGLAPVDAIKASINLVKDNLGNALVWAIVGYLVAGAGAIACGVGVLVTYPLVLIGTAYTYKMLTAQDVAA